MAEPSDTSTPPPPDSAGPPTLRLAHFSDIHLTATEVGWSGRDLLSKRLTGWMNLRLLGRGYRFRDAAAVAATLARDLHERRFDHLIFSGDATTMAFEAEMAEAARCLGVRDKELPPAMAVPGNHDYYIRSAAELGLFERYFEPWQVGERVDGHLYPFAQRVGHVWLVGVNSAKANFWTWDASGEVGHEQRVRLGKLLERLQGPRILVTHYPLCLPNGEPEQRWHRLRDWAAVLEVAKAGGVGLWVHGHRHVGYHRPPDERIPFPVICAGSATQNNRWTYNEYDITGRRVRALRRVYSVERGGYVDLSTFEVELTGAA